MAIYNEIVTVIDENGDVLFKTQRQENNIDFAIHTDCSEDCDLIDWFRFCAKRNIPIFAEVYKNYKIETSVGVQVDEDNKPVTEPNSWAVSLNVELDRKLVDHIHFCQIELDSYDIPSAMQDRFDWGWYGKEYLERYIGEDD